MSGDFCVFLVVWEWCFFFLAEGGIRCVCLSRGVGEVYRVQVCVCGRRGGQRGGRRNCGGPEPVGGRRGSAERARVDEVRYP